MKKCLVALTLAMTVLLFSGCVTGQRALTLTTPPITTPPAADKGALCIVSVTDNRVFQNNPSDPSIPSINGDVNTLTAGQKDVMIGRQRNTYGKAMGDIALTKGDSVTQRAQSLVETALKQRGYQITNDSSAPVTAAVSVDEFWAWFSPGAWSVSFEAKVTCTLTLTKANSPTTVTIKGYGLNRGQVARDANWQKVFDIAFADFLAKSQTELNATQF
jgi:uncharacterized lipoprotein YajG